MGNKVSYEIRHHLSNRSCNLVSAPRFRGCASAPYDHDTGCTDVKRQAVTVVEDKKSVNVLMDLCYCKGKLCNEERSGGSMTRSYVALFGGLCSFLVFLHR